MQTFKIINNASDTKDNDIVEIRYCREVKLMKTWQGKKVIKVSVFKAKFDERSFNDQLLRINGINNPSTIDQGYRKVNGCLYRKEEKEEFYIRLFATADKFETISVQYFSDGKEISYEEIESFLYASEKRDKIINDLQTSTGNAGHEVDRIFAQNYRLDRIISFKKVG